MGKRAHGVLTLLLLTNPRLQENILFSVMVGASHHSHHHHIPPQFSSWHPMVLFP